jgi:DNA polymerase beta
MSSEVNLNEDICKMLLELAQNEKNLNQNIHKFNAYRKAATSLSQYHKRIDNGTEAKQLKGIGDRIALKIDEFLKTGSVKQLDKIKSSGETNAINELMRVSGIGPTIAHKLSNDGINSIEELRKHESQLTHHQKIGLKYVEEFEKKIPRKEIQQIEALINKEMNKLDKNLLLTICGSYRREAKESGDIDVLVTHPKIKSHKMNGKNFSLTHLNDLIKSLENCGLITDRISMGETKFMGVCQLSKDLPHRRIDIRFLPIDHFYCAVLYFTGSQLFNQEMRRHAHENGFILNEYSLRKLGTTGVPGEPIRVKSEEEIFQYIDYPFKSPKDRNL